MPRPRTVSDGEILAAAAVVIGEIGPDRLTLGDVGRRVGLAPATLLQRFGSRRELLLALAGHDVDAVPARLRTAASAPGSLLDALVAALVDTASHIDSPARFANHLAFLLKDLADPDFQAITHRYGAGVTAAIRDVLAAAADRGELDADADADADVDALAHLVHVVYNGALVTWGMTSSGQPADRVGQHLRQVLAPYRAAGGRRAVAGSA
ncbi:transcriptional regulator, TetR family [Geodermatophilus dictyosporus]|uniref:Transcriptional regulator, TetR family n=1 Tax=Geodermatophilus dictyosporus TaxID=1523247 RepID=A0A1I5JS18_9ACTN|nr:helix-turn-helix domain-containing protein [Geodermatophilus dictyosporus]SFO75201.1 transcriptional regulator, TetR family [Geodermatophilus dictyosporus]